jgi:hypothetical protein
MPRLTSPCSEDLDAMEKTARGSFCSKCQHDVVDLRTTPRKKALKVLSELRAQSSSGRVCVRAMFSSDGTPVFRPDAPSAFTRFAAPIAMATSLAACAPSTRVETTTDVVAVVHDTHTGSDSGRDSGGNSNGQTRVVTAVVVPVEPPSPQPTFIFDGPVEAAGGMAWEPSP